MRRLARSLAGSVLILGLSLSAAAQQPSPPSSPPSSEPFGEVIDVRVVNVEVVVTDRDGNRVQGLKPGDFRLRVDGKEVPVDFFTEIRERQAVSPPAAGDPAAGPASLDAGEPVGTSYLVFIDDYFTVPARRNEHTAKLELRAAAADDKGNRSPVPAIPLTLSSDKPPKPGGYVRYDTEITVHGDASHLVVAVYDPLSGKISTAEAEVPNP